MTGSLDPRTGADDGSVHVDLSVAVARAPDAVYAFLADVEDAEPLPRRATVRMVEHPAGQTAVGTTWEERVPIAPGLWLDIDSVVTEARPPRRLAMAFRTRWFTGHLTYDIEPGAGGTTVLRQREVLVPRRLLRPFGRAVAGRLEPRLRERLDDIRDALATG